MVLTIFWKLIEIKANQYSKRATEWESEDWVENKESVEEMQNQLQRCGVVDLLARIVSQEKISLIKDECFYTSVALLVGGNKIC